MQRTTNSTLNATIFNIPAILPRPQDDIINTFLITNEAIMLEYSEPINKDAKYPKGNLSPNFGIRFTKIVPGYLSTEVNAQQIIDL